MLGNPSPLIIRPFTLTNFPLERGTGDTPINAVPKRQNFYDQRAAERPAAQKRHYHRLLKNYFGFLVPPRQRVLEMGCGVGDLLTHLQATRAVGVDFSPKAIELARPRHPAAEFHVADAVELITDRLADMVDVSAKENVA